MAAIFCDCAHTLLLLMLLLLLLLLLLSLCYTHRRYSVPKHPLPRRHLHCSYRWHRL
jgi:hypothetical protein